MPCLKKIVSVITICCFLVACIPAKPPPCLSEDIRDQIRVLAIKPSTEVPDIQIGKVIKSRGEGASKGASVAALGTLQAGAQSGDPFGFLFAILLIPVFTVGGAIYGAASSDSSKTIPFKLDSIKGKLTAADAQKYFAKDIRNELDKMNGRMEIREIEGAVPEEKEYDALLLTRVLQLTLENKGTINNRKLVIKVSVSAELVDPEGQLVHQRYIDYSSEHKSLSEWANLNVVTVRDMLTYISRELSRQIVTEFFMMPCPANTG